MKKNCRSSAGNGQLDPAAEWPGQLPDAMDTWGQRPRQAHAGCRHQLYTSAASGIINILREREKWAFY